MGELKSTNIKSPFKRITTYLPWLVAPVVILVLISFYQHLLHKYPDSPQQQATGLHEVITMLDAVAPWILVVALGVYWFKAIFTRNLTYVILGVMAACLLLRELHWDPMIKKAIFPVLGICLVWAIIWRDVIDRPMENWSHTVFFAAAIGTYALGQLVEKRIFRFIPGEATLHSQIEEGIEVTGHLLIFLAAVFGSWRRRSLSGRGK